MKPQAPDTGPAVQKCPMCGTGRNSARWPFELEYREEITQDDYDLEVARRKERADAGRSATLPYGPITAPRENFLGVICGRCYHAWREEIPA